MQEIQDIKTKYGQSSESIIANGLNLQKKGTKYRCPNNIAHKNGDRNPSMSWDSNALQYHCFTCGMNIDLYGYYREHLNYTHQEIVRELLGEVEHSKTSIVKNRNTFTEELKNITQITQQCIEYIKLRGISEETIKTFNLMSYKELIAFPYYKYETVVGYKTRKPVKDPVKPKMLSITGSKPYLFNAQNIEEFEELIICEGEFDCMVIHQCGFKNVVSVGAGANSLSTMIEQAKEFLDKFKYLLIVSDNDEAGTNMDKLFVEIFKEKSKLIDKKLYKRNDINEEYVVNGADAVKKIIESARFKIEGRRDLEEKPYTGLEKRTGSYIPTGIESVDNAINDLAPGLVTLIAGRSNGGKTTFTRQIIANAINKGNKVYVVSGEGDQETFINEIYQCVIGRNQDYYNTIKVNKKWHKEPKKEVLKALQQWHHKKLTLFNKGDSKLKTIDQLFEMIEYEIKLKGHNLVIIDNLMSILSVKATEKNEAQADFMQRCINLAQCYKSHIILVLHPNKEYKKGFEFDLEHISGTSDLPNKADNVIAVVREYDEDKILKGKNGEIAVIKNRYYSDLVTCEVHYEKETGLLVELKDGECLAYKFDWEKHLPNEFRKPEWVQHCIDSTQECPF